MYIEKKYLGIAYRVTLNGEKELWFVVFFIMAWRLQNVLVGLMLQIQQKRRRFLFIKGVQWLFGRSGGYE